MISNGKTYKESYISLSISQIILLLIPLFNPFYSFYPKSVFGFYSVFHLIIVGLSFITQFHLSYSANGGYVF